MNVLGYTKNLADEFNLITEQKNVKDSKKADGAIIFNDEVKAVIELKGRKLPTSLKWKLGPLVTRTTNGNVNT